MDNISDLEIIGHAIQALLVSFNSIHVILAFAIHLRHRSETNRVATSRTPKKFIIKSKVTRQVEHIRTLTLSSDETCINHRTSPSIPPSTQNDKEVSEFMSKGGTESSSTSARCGKSKARRVDKEFSDPLFETLTEYCERSDRKLDLVVDNIEALAAKKIAKMDPSDKRIQLFAILEKLEFPSLRARVDVGHFLAHSEKDLDYFLGMSDDAKNIFVEDILKKIHSH